MSGISTNQEAQIKGLAAKGNIIEAIKLYREITDVGLAEAKDAVEAIIRGEPVLPPIPAQSNAPVEEQIKHLLAKRQKILAVKLYRETYNFGLKDAKEAVDAIERDLRRESSPRLSGKMSASAISNSNDPFAEDKKRNRSCLILVIAILLVMLGGVVFFLTTNNGF